MASGTLSQVQHKHKEVDVTQVIGYGSSFMGWLQERPTWKQYWALILGVLLLKVVWSALVVSALSYVGGFPSEPDDPHIDTFEDWLSNLKVLHMGLFFLAMAFLEEFIFRFLPIVVGLLLFRWWAVTRPFVLIIALFASIGFAEAHGTGLHTYLLQGVGGFVYCVLFLKFSAMKLRYVFGSLIATWLMHASWNIGVLGLLSGLAMLFPDT